MSISLFGHLNYDRHAEALWTQLHLAFAGVRAWSLKPELAA
ncbi:MULTISPECIES: hypothetical protein [Pseudomonas]|nr:hypothetical protein [Pseudomonas fluorescens]